MHSKNRIKPCCESITNSLEPHKNIFSYLFFYEWKWMLIVPKISFIFETPVSLYIYMTDVILWNFSYDKPLWWYYDENDGDDVGNKFEVFHEWCGLLNKCWEGVETLEFFNNYFKQLPTPSYLSLIFYIFYIAMRIIKFFNYFLRPMFFPLQLTINLAVDNWKCSLLTINNNNGIDVV